MPRESDSWKPDHKIGNEYCVLEWEFEPAAINSEISIVSPNWGLGTEGPGVGAVPRIAQFGDRRAVLRPQGQRLERNIE